MYRLYSPDATYSSFSGSIGQVAVGIRVDIAFFADPRAVTVIVRLLHDSPLRDQEDTLSLAGSVRAFLDHAESAVVMVGGQAYLRRS